MKIIKNIKEGWGNYLKYFQTGDISDEVKELAETRAEICRNCPHLVESRTYSLIQNILPNGRESSTLTPENSSADQKVKGYKCDQCGCGFPAMVFAPDKKCVKGKW